MKTRQTHRGSVLLIVLWALILLSAAVLTWAKLVQQDIQLSSRANRELEAHAMAHSGMAIALHPLVTRQTPLLDGQFSEDMGYHVKMVGEGGKLNINWLLAGEQTEKLAIFKKWLEQMELDFQERELFLDSLLDYTDADNIPRLNGIEDKDDYHPVNRPLQSVDEIERVANAELLVTKRGWREQLTIYSQGPVDILAADETMLRLLPGVSEPRMQAFLAFRRGKDGEDGTIDDPEFKSLEEILSRYLGMGKLQQQALGGLLGMRDPVMHIVSEGRAGKVVRQLEVVARKGGTNPTILYWKE
jgi:hypothetical protein